MTECFRLYAFQVWKQDKDFHLPHLLGVVWKGVQSGKEEVKPPQSADDMIFCIENLEMCIYRKILRNEKWIQQDHRIQDQHEKTNCISLY